MTTDLRVRNNIRIMGRSAGPVLLLAHGFGCDQGVWDRVLPYFVDDYKVVVFDHVGVGGSDLDAYDAVKYSSLDGYVSDLLEICRELELKNVTLVGHSVSAMMAVAAAVESPELFADLVLLASSPSYLDYPSDSYVGGFTAADIADLLDSLDTNYLSWAATMAPVIMGNPQSPELGTELAGSFCRINPAVARGFARVAFLSDVRHLLAGVRVPALILQCSNDLLVPDHLGTYTEERMPMGTLARLQATGHLPHVSSPDETAQAILSYLRRAG